MYTLCTDHYKKHAALRDGTFYILTRDSYLISDSVVDQLGSPRVYHDCPVLRLNSGSEVGIIFLDDDINEIMCDRCHRRPSDKIITLIKLLEA